MIRAKHNRRLEHELKYLLDAIAQVPASGNLEVLVPKHDGKPPRTAILTLRYASFTILPPQNSPQNRNPKPINLNVVFAVEENPPTGVEAINWLLLTTLDVNNFDDAVRCIRWYTYRWFDIAFTWKLAHSSTASQTYG